jgi:hypothetical protein
VHAADDNRAVLVSEDEPHNYLLQLRRDCGSGGDDGVGEP